MIMILSWNFVIIKNDITMTIIYFVKKIRQTMMLYVMYLYIHIVMKSF